MSQRFPVGTKYKQRGKSYVCEVIDFHVTTNLKGEVVKERYLSQHDFAGMKIKDFDVVETTIAIGEIK